MSDLPTGWAVAAISDVAEVIAGQAPPGESYNKVSDGMPLFQGKTDFGDLYLGAPRLWTTAPSRVASKDDVLVSVRAPVGPTNLAPQACAIGRGLAAIRGGTGISQHYLLYAMRSSVWQLENKATGTTFAAITTPVLRAHPIPVAPTAEQERIVAAIEEEFSRLDAGAAALERVRQSLKRLRGAILDQIASPPRGLNNPRMSAGAWPREPLGGLVADRGGIVDGPFGSNLKSSHHTDSGPRVIRLQNIGDGEFVDARAHISEAHFQSLRRHDVQPGDLVCAIRGEVLPRVVLVPDQLGPAIVKADCPRIRLSPHMNPRYVWAVLNAPSTREQTSLAIRGVGRPRLTVKALRAIMIPAPPRDVQDAIVAHMDTSLAEVSRVERAVSRALSMQERLRSGILGAAFSGRLVSQDPGNEPASVLLGRIAADRPSFNGDKPSRTRKPPRKANA